MVVLTTYVQPFDPELPQARIRALLRRACQPHPRQVDALQRFNADASREPRRSRTSSSGPAPE